MWWVWLGLHLILTSRTERPVLSHLSCKFSGCFKGLNKDQPSVPHFIFSEGQIRCYFLRSHRVDSCPGTRDSSHFYLRIIYRRLYHTTHTVVHKQPADVTVSFPTLSDVVLSNLWIHVIVIRRCQGWFTPRLLEKWSGRILKDIDFVLFHFVKYLRNLCCSVHRWINTGYNTQSLMSLFFSECKQKNSKHFMFAWCHKRTSTLFDLNKSWGFFCQIRMYVQYLIINSVDILKTIVNDQKIKNFGLKKTFDCTKHVCSSPVSFSSKVRIAEMRLQQKRGKKVNIYKW